VHFAGPPNTSLNVSFQKAENEDDHRRRTTENDMTLGHDMTTTVCFSTFFANVIFLTYVSFRRSASLWSFNLASPVLNNISTKKTTT